MPSAASNEERRRYRRFPSANLKAQVKVKKGLFSEWQDVDVSDFNDHGMAILVPRKSKYPTRLTFRLMLEMDMGVIKIDRLEADCVNKLEKLDRHRIGLQFDGATLEKSKHLRSQLSRIQRILEKSTTVKTKLGSQT